MKRYLLFAGMDYYPHGGITDFAGSFDTHDEALAHLRTLPIDVSGSWADIVDTVAAWSAQSYAGTRRRGWVEHGGPYPVEPTAETT